MFPPNLEPSKALICMPKQYCGKMNDCAEINVNEHCSANVACEVPDSAEDIAIEIITIVAFLVIITVACFCVLKKKKREE